MDGDHQKHRWKVGAESPWNRLRRRLRRFFESVWVECTIGILVIVSVGLTLSEMALEASGVSYYDPDLVRMRVTNDSITFVFIVELALRFIAATSKIRFLKEFWLDILAVVPLFRVFRVGRALRLLRLVRLLRLFGVMSRMANTYPTVFKKGLGEYLAICGLLIMTVIFGTISMMYFENRANQPVANQDEPVEGGVAESDEETSDRPQYSFETSFWFSVYSLFAGEPVGAEPETRGGKIITVIVMFMGLTIFAMFTGTVSAYMVDRFRTEGRVIQYEELSDHIIICGWNAKTEIIIGEYRAAKRTKTTPIVVICEQEPETIGVSDEIRNQVHFLHDDFTRVYALERAGIHRARTCILLSDTSGGRSDQDADARTILGALTVEKLNPEVYTCAELQNRAYGTHLEMGHVNDYVVSGEYSAYMMAQAAMNRGLMGVLGELLTYQRGNEFYRHPVPEAWVGRSFPEAMAGLKQSHNAILVAVYPKEGKLLVNPADYELQAGDEIVVIASHDVDFSM